MKTVFIWVVAIGLLIQSPAWCDDDKALEGIWVPSTGEFGGKKFPDEILKATKLMIKDGKYTVTVGKQADKGTIKLNSDKKPKAIDIIGTDGPNKGKTILAIYELNGDSLKVCYDLGGKDRPAEFKTKEESMLFLVNYKRIKE
jgi:uncharacterized protein (TIGR03067 family)